MYKIYFKQAIEMLKQNKFISMIAILGTALAIMMIMAIIVTEDIKNISAAPEINRHRTYYVDRQSEKESTAGGESTHTGPILYSLYRDYLADMQTPEHISFTSPGWNGTFCKPGSNDIFKLPYRITDASFWKIFAFKFIEGKPYTQEDFESGIPCAVISESTSGKIFKGEKALGETILVNYNPYRVVGIVKDVSRVFTVASGDVWIPYSPTNENNPSGCLLLTLKKPGDLPAVNQEVRDVEKKVKANDPNKTLTLNGPHSHRVYRMEFYSSNNENTENLLRIEIRKRIFIFLILLLIPAINLSGLSFSRMKKRTEEIGIRKAFGAKKYIILIQVLYENLITSLIGGFIGLFLSYLAIFNMKEWLLKLPEESTIPISTLASLPVLLAVFLVCLLLNLLSAGIPAYRASRMTIVNSLHKNDK